MKPENSTSNGLLRINATDTVCNVSLSLKFEGINKDETSAIIGRNMQLKRPN
jgi:hypothetical protein